MQKVHPLWRLQDFVGVRSEDFKWPDFTCPKCGSKVFSYTSIGIRCANRQCSGNRPRVPFTSKTIFKGNKYINFQTGLQILLDLQEHFDAEGKRLSLEHLSINASESNEVTAASVGSFLSKVASVLPDELKLGEQEIPNEWFNRNDKKSVYTAIYRLLFEGEGKRPAFEVLSIIVEGKMPEYDELFRPRIRLSNSI